MTPSTLCRILSILLAIVVRVSCGDAEPCEPRLGARDASWYRESVRLVTAWRQAHPGVPATVTPADVTALARWVDLLRWEGCINPAGMTDLPHRIRWAVRDLARLVEAGDRAAAKAAAADCRRRLEAVSADWYADGTPGGTGNWHAITGWSSCRYGDGGIVLTCTVNGSPLTVPLSITAYAGGIWRIHSARTGVFKPDGFRPLALSTAKEGDGLLLNAPGSRLEIRRDPFRLTLSANGRVLWDQRKLEILTGSSDGIVASRLVAALHPDDRFLGGGERFAAVEQRGRVLTHWATDAIVSSVDGIWSEAYKPIPWLVNPRGLGLFLNTTAQAHLDLGATDPQQARCTLFGSLCDLFFFVGTPRESLARYCQLTGAIVRPPAWAFAPWMGAGTETWNSRGSELGPAYVKEVTERMAREGLPCEAMYIEGIANHQPPGKELLGWLRGRQVRALNWYGPTGEPEPEDRRKPSAKDLERFFLHRADGSLFRVAKGRFLEGQAYVDFTHPDIDGYLQRRWGWHADAGISGNMIDGGEEVPLDVVAANGMRGTELHNAYGFYYDSAMKRLFQGRLGDDHLLLARSGGAGRQGVCHFSGDLPGTFAGLAAAVRAGATSGASALAMWGSDIGGYYEHGGALSGEVFLRWAAFGAFSPLMRVHSQKAHFPWMWDDRTLRGYRRLSWIRQALRPYLEACADDCRRTGAPFMAPPAFAYPDEPTLWQLDDEYMLGDALLVAPVVTPAGHRQVALPPGSWYELLGDWRPWQGPATIRQDAPPDGIPVLLSAGSILPLRGGQKTLVLGEAFAGGGTPWLVVAPDAGGACRPRALGEDSAASVAGGRLRVTGPTSFRVLVVTAAGARDAGTVAAGRDLPLGGR